MPKLAKLFAPKTLNGKQFEELCLFDAKYWENQPASPLTMGRYGVQVSVRKGEGGRPIYTPLRSLPDFEGIYGSEGLQFIFDAKTCTQPSFGSTALEEFLQRQYRHMKKRSQYGAICFILIHFNERKLKTKVDQAATYALSVSDSEIWKPIETGELKSLTRAYCQEFGVNCRWWTPANAVKARPNLNQVLKTLLIRRNR